MAKGKKKAPKDGIVRAAIYPPIGIARIGNSKDEFYIGPEVTTPIARPRGYYRDGSGALKREAARFRIYGLDADGVAVKELTADDAEIEWRVHVANHKSEWYEFQLALDIPEAADAPQTRRRNAPVTNRKKLIIDPGHRDISGCDTQGEKYHFDDGKFMGKKVALGELRTDEAGRLLFLGGHGKSSSYEDWPAYTFGNNETWHDDTSDGPVRAKVVYGGNELEVESAWVVVAPPNYAPMLKSVRTMWDLMRDVAVSAGMTRAPAKPSFTDDILPLLERLSGLQWVNAGFAAAFGWGGPSDLTDPDVLARLASGDASHKELRRTIANNFRHPKTDAWSPAPWPWLYGDAMDVPPAETPRQNSSLTDLQLRMLGQWADGNFEADYDPESAPVTEIGDLPVAEQPDMLTRAAMDYCLADAFHPGCEMTWPMRQAGMYARPFRVRESFDRAGERCDAEVLDGATAIRLIDAGQSPGSLTRWMAVPWQTDTGSCRGGYYKAYDPYLPTFWPARVPNQVLSEASYDVVKDPDATREARLKAFARREQWIEPLGLSAPYQDQINHMIHHFDQMAVVEHRAGVDGDPDFPSSMQVADRPRATDGTKAALMSLDAGLDDETREETDLSTIDKVCRFPDGLSK